VITKDDIRAAAERIRGRVRVTPLVAVEVAAFGHPVTLKLEHLQHAGSFKPRGTFNRLLSHPIPAAGVIAASGGNHGLAVAYAARELGVPAEVFVPETSSPVKVARLRAYGARVDQVGREYAEALAASQERAAVSGALVVHAYDDPEVQAGQGTVGMELGSEFDTVLVAVGGGGLIGGIAAWFEGAVTGAAGGRVKVVAVEPVGAPTLANALSAGHPVDVDVDGVAADSLGARRISALTLETAIRTHVGSVLVDDKAIMHTRQVLWDELRLAVEAGGATALAALVTRAYQPAPDERVAVVVCGANTDPGDLVNF
jgi:threonine dehydratase